MKMVIPCLQYCVFFSCQDHVLLTGSQSHGQTQFTLLPCIDTAYSRSIPSLPSTLRDLNPARDQMVTNTLRLNTFLPLENSMVALNTSLQSNHTIT